MKYQRGEFQDVAPATHGHRTLVVALALIVISILFVTAIFYKSGSDGKGGGFDWGPLGKKEIDNKPLTREEIEKIPGKISNTPSLSQQELDAIPGPHK